MAAESAIELAIKLVCMVLPLKQQRLLVPSVNVAEIIDDPQIQTVAVQQSWYLGNLIWRQSLIPLIDFDNFSSGSSVVNTVPKVAVLNVVSAQENLGFFAIALQQTPYLVKVHPGELMPVELMSHELMPHELMPHRIIAHATLACVQLDYEQVFIPDLALVEQAVLDIAV